MEQTMSHATLKVTLKNGNLDVDQSGNVHHVARGRSVTITWHLAGADASRGAFNAINGQHDSGFAWVQPPPSGIFGEAQLAHNGKKITLVDNNADPGGINSAGDWIYQLCATIDGVTYWTITDLQQ